jgi:hypothetical protein
MKRQYQKLLKIEKLKTTRVLQKVDLLHYLLFVQFGIQILHNLKNLKSSLHQNILKKSWKKMKLFWFRQWMKKILKNKKLKKP